MKTNILIKPVGLIRMLVLVNWLELIELMKRKIINAELGEQRGQTNIYEND